MRAGREEYRVGPAYLDAVTALLQRVRNAHPTKGLFEAADLQWWWRVPRSSDAVPQLFWFDDDSRPEAAVIITAWRDWVALDPLVMPDASPDWIAHIVERGLAHAADHGVEAVQLEVDRADDALTAALLAHGFTIDEDEQMVETWMDSDDRPAISPLADGYRLCTRLDTAGQPHHLIGRSGPDVERRLNETSLYRADLDLVVLDSNGDPAASGLFWFDPVTATGLVEPMRTEDDHQRRGLARHVLTSGIDRLAAAGAQRIKIIFEQDNAASKHLYLSAGFQPVKETVLFAGPTDGQAGSPGATLT